MDRSSSFYSNHKAGVRIGVLFVVVACLIGIFFMVMKRVQIEAGFEAVLVDKPFWTMFGKGGVRPEPLQTGSQWLFFTTEMVPYDMRPHQWSEAFDDVKDGTITADNVPIDFNAYIKTRPVAGKTPQLHAKFGPTWYAQNVKEVFRTSVRDEVAKHPMTKLTTRQEDGELKEEVLQIMTKIVLKEMRDFVKEKGIDVEVMEVIIGKVTPPQKVLDQLADTAAQQQRSKTEDERGKAEVQRKDAEEKRANADNAYRNKMELSPTQFVQLEIAKQQVAAVKSCGESKGCTSIIGALGGAQPVIPIK